jgi:hypothetical protein
MLLPGSIAGALYNLLLLHLVGCLYYCTCYTLFLFNTYWLFSILASPQLNKIYYYYYYYYYYCCCYCVLPRIKYYLKVVLRENLSNITKTSMSNRQTDTTMIPYLIYRLRNKNTNFTYSADTWRLWWWSLMSFRDRSLPAWNYRTVQRKVLRAEGSYRC